MRPLIIFLLLFLAASMFQLIQNSNANGSGGGTVNHGYSYVIGAVSQTSVYPGNPAVVSNATWFVDTGLTRVDSAYELTTVANVPANGSIVRFYYDAAGLRTRQTGAGWQYDATGKAKKQSKYLTDYQQAEILRDPLATLPGVHTLECLETSMALNGLWNLTQIMPDKFNRRGLSEVKQIGHPDKP